MKAKSRWGSVAPSSLVTTALQSTEIPNFEQNNGLNDRAFDPSMLDVKLLDYNLRSEGKGLGYGRGGQRAGANIIPPSFSRKEVESERESLVWVAYASQQRQV